MSLKSPVFPSQSETPHVVSCLFNVLESPPLISIIQNETFARPPFRCRFGGEIKAA